MPCRVLTVLPLARMTRTGLFYDGVEVMRREIRHDRKELSMYDEVPQQWSHRLRALEDSLSELPGNMPLQRVDAVITPADVVPRLHGGVYAIDEEFIENMRKDGPGDGALNLSVLLADALARPRSARAFAIVPLSREDYEPISIVSGLPELPFDREIHSFGILDSILRASVEMKRPFTELSVIVACLGASFLVCAHQNGRVLDISDSGERGPFSLKKSGSVPAARLITMAFSGMWSIDKLMENLSQHGGVESYTGRADLDSVMGKYASGDVYAGMVVRSLAYQVAQEISAQAVVLRGDVEAVILTGSCAENRAFVDLVKERISWISDNIIIYPDVDDLTAMANIAFRVLERNDMALSYREEIREE